MKFANIKKFPHSNYTINVPVKSIKAQLDNWGEDGLLDLNPIFQREHVWTTEQRIAYIEYLLKEPQSGRDFYFNNPTWFTTFKEPTVLVDGKQRLTSILMFLDNKIPAYDTLYKDFEDNFPISLTVVFHVAKLEKESDVVEWYLDFNAGGTPHSKEEIERVKQYHKELLVKGL